MRTAFYTVFMICGLVAPGGAQQTQPAAIPVGVVKAEHKSIEKTLDFVGRIEAVNRVEIRARVQGFLEAVLFKEGDRFTRCGRADWRWPDALRVA
jgi:membrane fusion protein (multidrug efflux system)